MPDSIIGILIVVSSYLLKPWTTTHITLQKGAGNFKWFFLNRKSNADSCLSCAIKTVAECSNKLWTVIFKFTPSLVASCRPFSTKISQAITIHTYTSASKNKEKNIIQRSMRKYLLWQWNPCKWLIKTETMTNIRILFTLLRIEWFPPKQYGKLGWLLHNHLDKKQYRQVQKREQPYAGMVVHKMNTWSFLSP